MADITDQHDQTSPTELDESQSVGNGSAAAESRGIKRQRPSAGDDDDDDDEKGGRERRKIEIKFISDKSRRHITFSKRKAGIMKKVRPVLTHRVSPHLHKIAAFAELRICHLCLCSYPIDFIALHAFPVPKTSLLYLYPISNLFLLTRDA